MIQIKQSNQVILGKEVTISRSVDEMQILELIYKDMLKRGIVIEGEVKLK